MFYDKRANGSTNVSSNGSREERTNLYSAYGLFCSHVSSISNGRSSYRNFIYASKGSNSHDITTRAYFGFPGNVVLTSLFYEAVYSGSIYVSGGNGSPWVGSS